MLSSPATRVAAGPYTPPQPHTHRRARRPGPGLQPRTPQPSSRPSSGPASAGRPAAVGRPRPADQDTLHRRTSPLRSATGLLVAPAPARPAPPAPAPGTPPPTTRFVVRVARAVTYGRPDRRTSPSPAPAPEQRQVRRVGPGPQPRVPPPQLPLTPPPGPRRVGHHQRRVQRHHRPTRVVPLEEPHQLLVGGRPPLGDDCPVRVEHGQPRRPPPTPRQVDPHEPHGADATRPRSGCGRLVWLGRGRPRRGRGGRARRRGCGARRRRRRR